jgi:hypothetical protein
MSAILAWLKLQRNKNRETDQTVCAKISLVGEGRKEEKKGYLQRCLIKTAQRTQTFRGKTENVDYKWIFQYKKKHQQKSTVSDMRVKTMLTLSWCQVKYVLQISFQE